MSARSRPTPGLRHSVWCSVTSAGCTSETELQISSWGSTTRVLCRVFLADACWRLPANFSLVTWFKLWSRLEAEAPRPRSPVSPHGFRQYQETSQSTSSARSQSAAGIPSVSLSRSLFLSSSPCACFFPFLSQSHKYWCLVSVLFTMPGNFGAIAPNWENMFGKGLLLVLSSDERLLLTRWRKLHPWKKKKKKKCLISVISNYSSRVEQFRFPSLLFGAIFLLFI